MSAQIKGLIFDKDGTLFDFNATWGAWALTMFDSESKGDPARMRALADALGYDLSTKQFLPGSIVIAETVDVLADHILPHIADPDKSALIARMNTAATQVPQIEATPLVPFFDELRFRGFRLGVATNDSEAPARAHLTKAHIAAHFDFIAGADSGFGGKPAAGQLDAFCRATGLAPNECAMVGDSLHDLHAGRAAGMTTVGVLTGPAMADELRPAADVVLSSIAELPAWLDQYS
jgi:phosphoglycolate phosphatase